MWQLESLFDKASPIADKWMREAFSETDMETILTDLF